MLQRLGLGVLTLFVVSIIIFTAIAMLPGDFAKAILGQAATPETVAAFQHEVGLDRPPVLRYFIWIAGVLHGDFGNSFASAGSLGGGHARTVMSLIAPRLANTLFLAGFAAVIAVPLSLGLGMLAALYRGSIFDRNGNFVSGTQKLLQLRLKDETLQGRLGSGITLKSSFDVKPGSYIVRLVVRDEDGQLAAQKLTQLK